MEVHYDLLSFATSLLAQMNHETALKIKDDPACKKCIDALFGKMTREDAYRTLGEFAFGAMIVCHDITVENI